MGKREEKAPPARPDRRRQGTYSALATRKEQECQLPVKAKVNLVLRNIFETAHLALRQVFELNSHHAVTIVTESPVLLCLLMAQNDNPRICNCTREYTRRAVIANGQKRKEIISKYSPANKLHVVSSFLSYNAM